MNQELSQLRADSMRYLKERVVGSEEEKTDIESILFDWIAFMEEQSQELEHYTSGNAQNDDIAELEATVKRLQEKLRKERIRFQDLKDDFDALERVNNQQASQIDLQKKAAEEAQKGTDDALEVLRQIPVEDANGADLELYARALIAKMHAQEREMRSLRNKAAQYDALMAQMGDLT